MPETIQYHIVTIDDETFKHRVGQLEIGVLLDGSMQPTNLCLSAVKGGPRGYKWENRVGQAFCKEGAAGISVAFEVIDGEKVSAGAFPHPSSLMMLSSGYRPVLGYQADYQRRPTLGQPA